MGDADRCILIVDGSRYEGWTSISVTRALDNVASQFQFTAVDPGVGDLRAMPLRVYDECQVYLGDTPVLSGYIDDITAELSTDSHTVAISGRSRTGQAVDCSAPTRTWKLASLYQIAYDLVRPLGIEVVTVLPLTPIMRAASRKGDRCHQVIQRLAETEGVLIYDDADGALVIGVAGIVPCFGALKTGVNILSIRVAFKGADRYRTYSCKGQRGADIYSQGATLAESEATVSDGTPPAWRTLDVDMERAASYDDCRRRALYEGRVRAGKSTEVSVTVQGWRQPDGSLWTPNQLVWVWAPEVGIQDELLIASCTYTQGLDGTRCEMTLHPSDAYLPEPNIVGTTVHAKSPGLWVGKAAVASAVAEGLK